MSFCSERDKSKDLFAGRVVSICRLYACVWLIALLLVTLPSAPPATAEPAHGYSPIHELKYPEGFTHFDYVEPSAPKGGVIRLAQVGTFDSLNTLYYPGTTPADLRNYVYDRLIIASADEAAGYYGLLAETIDVAADLSWVRFKLHADARWNDGKPVTAEDVVFTFETLLKHGAPYYRQVLRLYTIETASPRTVTFRTKRPGDREFVRIVGGLPIHPKHFWEDRDARRKSLRAPLGSGPYRVKSVDAGRSLVLERVPDYWAKSRPVNVGRHNFDLIQIEYFRDATVTRQALAAGQFDVWQEGDAAQWSSAYETMQRNGRNIQQTTFDLDTPGKIATLVFNLRRPLFQDRRVRQAIALAYNHEWTNRFLFNGRYKPVESFYGDTPLGARGPMTPAEKAILGERIDAVPEEAMDRPGPDLREGAKDDRAAFRKANALLDEAGLRVVGGKRLDPVTGQALVVEVIYNNPALVRVFGPFARNLERLGITLSYPLLEATAAVRKKLDHDFDMADLTMTPRLVAGNAERLLWGSALADRKGTYALAGAKDPVLDSAIAAMLKATNRESLQAATRLFDRAMRWQRYVVPLWRNDEVWIAHWDNFGRPQTAAKVYPSYVDRWWSKRRSVD